MKKIMLSLTVFAFAIMFSQINAQEGMLTSEETLIGESADFFVGFHTGIFDCNQSAKYPYNLGVVAQYNYIPDVAKKWFFGAELGAFYIKGAEDDLGRITKLALGDLNIYPLGLSFPIKSEVKQNDNAALRLKKISKARKFKVGLGFAVAFPLMKKSTGPGVNVDAIKTGIGLTIRSSYDLPNRMTLFFNATSIGKDMDGLAYKSSTSLERSNGNQHDLTIYYKIGVMWNFLKK